MSHELEAIGEAITAALETCPATEVLQVVTGAFVGLTVELVRRQGGPLDKPILIDGCGNRNITIHPIERPSAQKKEGGR